MKDYSKVKLQIIKMNSDIITSSREDEQGMYDLDIFF